MAEVGFYHLLTMTVDRALPKLLERAMTENQRIVEVVTSFADLISIIVPIPRLELKATMLTIDNCLIISGFLSRLGGCSRDDRIHELQRSLRRFSHLIFDLPSSKAREAEELGLLSPELGEAGNEVARIIGIAMFGAIP